MAIINGILQAPLNPYAICEYMGAASSGDVGTVCTSPKINMWSKNKPLNIYQPEDLTDSQKKQEGYGIYALETEIENGAQRGAALDAIKANKLGKWYYLRPSSEHFKRLTDSVGYMHSSKCPFVVECNDKMGTSGESLLVYFPIGITSKSVEIFVGEDFVLDAGNMRIADCINIFGDNSNVEDWANKGYGIIFREGTSGNASISELYDSKDKPLYPITKLTVKDDEQVWYQNIPITLQVNKEYELCAVIVNMHQSTSYLVPESFLKIRTLIFL